MRNRNIDKFGKMPVPGDFILYPGPNTSIKIYEVMLVEPEYIKAVQYSWYLRDGGNQPPKLSKEVKLTGMNGAVIIPRELLPF